MNRFIEFRTNANFNLSYETGKLEPHLEMIFVCANVTYKLKSEKLTEGTSIVDKNVTCKDLRIVVSPDEIDEIIGILTEMKNVLFGFEKMSELYAQNVVAKETK